VEISETVKKSVIIQKTESIPEYAYLKSQTRNEPKRIASDSM